MEIGTLLWKFVLALALGFITGLERDNNWKSKSELVEAENRQTAHKKFTFIKERIPAKGLGGVRTYVLISLLGALSGLAHLLGLSYVTGIILVGLILFVVAAFVLNYFDKNTLGLTTEISIIFCFTISLLLLATDIPVKIVIALIVFDAVILSLKAEMHSFISKFSSREVVDTLKFILIIAVILPFLPNHSYAIVDIPYIGNYLSSFNLTIFEVHIFNPFTLWMIVVFISSINYIGYFLIKVVGDQRGLSITGFLGGLVSSTTVTQQMATHSKGISNPKIKGSLVSATIWANLTSFIRVLIITFFLNRSLFLYLIAPMLSMTLILLLWIVWYHDDDNLPKSKLDKPSKFNFTFKSPFSFGPALKFALMFMALLIFTNLARELLGNSGFILSSIVSAFSGMDFVAINTSSAVGSIVTVEIGVITIVVATIVNFIVKMFFVSAFGDSYFKKAVNSMFIISSIVGIIVSVLSLYIL